MSDNVSRLPAKRPWTLQTRILVFALVLVVVTLISTLFFFRGGDGLTAFQRWTGVSADAGAGEVRFSYDAHTSNQYVCFQDGLAVASVTGLSVYDPAGGPLAVRQLAMSTPTLEVGGRTVLCYDVSGQALEVVNRKGVGVLSLTTSRTILDADVSEGDWVCCSTQETGYKSVLNVYNPDGDAVYQWLSSSQYLPLCTIRSDGEVLAAVGLGQANGVFESRMELFRTDAEEKYGSFTLGSELVYDLKFASDELLCVIGENSTMWVRLDGTLQGRYTYGTYLKDFDFGGDGFLTLSLNMYKAGNRGTVVTVDWDGEELGRLDVSEELLDVAAAGETVAVLTAGSLVLFDKNLQELSRMENTVGATHVVLRADGSAVLLSGGQGTVCKP